MGISASKVTNVEIQKGHEKYLLIYIYRVWKLFNTFRVMTGLQDADSKSTVHPQWILDYQLVEWGQQGLFYEYLEMGKTCRMLFC